MIEAMRASFATRRMVKMCWQHSDAAPDLARAVTVDNEAGENGVVSAGRGGCDVCGGGGGVTVFCDLDGVLTDFDRGVRETTGRLPLEQPLAKMWQRVLSRGGFFQGLEWLPGAQAMWEAIVAMVRGACHEKDQGQIERGHAGAPTILSGIPFRHKKMVSREKSNWCREKMGTFQPTSVITCLSADKGDYSGPGRILIDDSPEHRHSWCLHGGTFIHHVSRAVTPWGRYPHSTPT